MSQDSTAHAQPKAGDLDTAVDQAIAACGGDARATVKALLVANEFLETQNRELKAAVSPGYVRGSLPPDRKDWYD